MSRWEAWLFHVLTLVVSVTGVVYFWMKYFMETDDPLRVINHPLQPILINAHILTAPFLVFIAGLITHTHIIKKLRNKSKVSKLSGLLSLFSFPLMTISGYLLQVTADETASHVIMILHLASGVIFAGSYLVHQVMTFQIWIKQRRSKTNLRRNQLVRT